MDAQPFNASYVSHDSDRNTDGYLPPNGPPAHPVHARVDPDEGSDSSSVGDDIEVASITSSIEDHLT